jgi:hypothetical protein
MKIEDSFWKKYAEHYLLFMKGNEKSGLFLKMMNKRLRINELLNPFCGWIIKGVEFPETRFFYLERFTEKEYAVKLAKELNIPLEDIFYFPNPIKTKKLSE